MAGYGEGPPREWLDLIDSDTTYGRSSRTTARSNNNHPREERREVCDVNGELLGAYPVGFSVEGAQGITFISLFQGGKLSESLCLQECCSLGHLKCQYVWFYRDQCVAVACSPFRTDYCQYELVPPRIPSYLSKYVWVSYTSLEETERLGNIDSQPQTEGTPTEGTMSSLHYVTQPPTVGMIFPPPDVVSPMSTTQPPISPQKSSKLLVFPTKNPKEDHFTEEVKKGDDLTKEATTVDQTMPKPTITTKPFPPTVAVAAGALPSTDSSPETGYSLFVIVGVPVLCIVLVILIASGCIVVASSCILFQEDKRLVCSFVCVFVIFNVFAGGTGIANLFIPRIHDHLTFLIFDHI